MTLAQADVLPANGGYVAAAYLVFLALLVIYFAIMASKLARLERELVELNELADRKAAEGTPLTADAVAAEVPSP